MTLWSVKYRPPGHLMQDRRTCNGWKVIKLALNQMSAQLSDCTIVLFT